MGTYLSLGKGTNICEKKKQFRHYYHNITEKNALQFCQKNIQ